MQKITLQVIAGLVCSFIPDPVTSLLVNLLAEIAIDLYYRYK